MTGVPVTNSEVEKVYQIYEQQLPSVENIDGFLGSHQMAVAQMALTYCSELIDGRGSIPRDSYFPGFNFNQNEDIAFADPADRNLIIDPLLKAAINWDQTNGDLTTQPQRSDVRESLASSNVGGLVLSYDDTGGNPQTENYTSLIQEMVDNCNSTLTSCDSPARTAAIVKGTCAAAIGAAVMLVQ